IGGEQPCVDRVAVGVLDLVVLDLAGEGPVPAAAVGGQLSQLPVFDREDLVVMVAGGRDHRRTAAAGGDRAAGGFARGERLDLAVDAEPVGMRVAVVRGERYH